MGPVSDHSNGHHRRSRRRIRKLHRRTHSISFSRLVSHRAARTHQTVHDRSTLVQWLRGQFIESTTPGGCDDPVSHFHQHSRAANGKAHPKHVHVHKNRSVARTDRRRVVPWLEQRKCCVHVFVVGIVGKRLATFGGASLVRAVDAGTAGACVVDDVRSSNGWTTLRAVCMEQRYVHG